MKTIHACVFASFAAASVMALLTAPSAHAQAYKVLYTFTGGSDARNPMSGVIRDAKGNLYGTTYSGGAFGYGTVFKLNRTGKETVLHSFVGYPTDGGDPLAGLIQDTNGNLYGTTAEGGSGPCGYAYDTIGCGTVFKLSKAGKETVLYSFCTRSNCTDGVNPSAGLIEDAKGNLYGTTQLGGSSSGGSSGNGTVFKLSKTGRQTVLYSFPTTRIDGATPYAGVIRDAKGTFYGTTLAGGTYNEGTVFKLTKTGVETVLRSFFGYPIDGEYPYAGLIQDAQGNSYGTTYQGGVYSYFSGTVFKLSKAGKETVLYSFCLGGGGCTDGERPNAGLVRDAKGDLYGTTVFGGTYNGGTVFKVDSSGKETVLHNFPSSGPDGNEPFGGLIQDAKGDLYGTTYEGGDYGYGVVFKLTP